MKGTALHERKPSWSHGALTKEKTLSSKRGNDREQRFLRAWGGERKRGKLSTGSTKEGGKKGPAVGTQPVEDKLRGGKEKEESSVGRRGGGDKGGSLLCHGE